MRLWSLESGPAGIPAERLPRYGLPGMLRYPLAVPALRRALAGFRPDLVDAHFVPNYGLMGALAGVHPLAVAPWGSDLLVTGLADRLQSARARFVLTRADLIIADSDNLAAAARALGGGDRVRAIPWGIDLTLFRAGPQRERGLLLSTRMHERIYDLPTLVHGVRPVLEARPEASFVVAGAGRLTGELERLAERVLPRGRWRFVGHLSPPELAGWLARADLYLSASLSDSTSLSLLEAMAAGAVPVVSDLEGNRQWVAEGEGARLFPLGDRAGVTRAVLAVMDDPAWAEGARRRNRAVVEHDADFTVNMGRIERLFEELASRPRRPHS